MKKILILLLLGACSQFSKTPILSETSKDSPGWIYAPYEACVEAEFLCAVGEAKTYALADLEARANLASIFEVKVQSELNVLSSATASFPWQASVKEEVQKSLKESVDQILETVQILKHHKEKTLTYSLAALDRLKATELLGNRLSKLDQELESLWRAKQRTNLRKIIRLHMEREKLHERYSIVSGSQKPASVTYPEILKWRESRPAKEPLSLKIGQSPDWLTLKIKELLTESGFKVVKGDAQKVLTVNVESIKEFLNVSGFEKYTFTLNMASLENGEKNKVLSTSETVSGRSQADALLKIKSYFLSYIEDHLSDLQLD